MVRLAKGLRRAEVLLKPRAFGVWGLGVWLGLLLAAPYAEAIEISGNPTAHVGGGVDFYYAQGAHLERELRVAYTGRYKQYLESFVVEGSLIVAPDTGENSGEVSIFQDYYMAYAGAGVAWPALFRFTATVGPTLVWERIEYDAVGSSESLSDWDSGIMGRFGIDYAFTAAVEATLGFGLTRRLGAEKTDLYYGFSVGANI